MFATPFLGFSTIRADERVDDAVATEGERVRRGRRRRARNNDLKMPRNRDDRLRDPVRQLGHLVEKVVRGDGSTDLLQWETDGEKIPWAEDPKVSFTVTLPNEIRERCIDKSVPLSFKGDEGASSWAQKHCAQMALQELTQFKMIPDPRKLFRKQLKGTITSNRGDVTVEYEQDDDSLWKAIIHVRIPLLRMWKDVTGDPCEDRKAAVINAAQKAVEEVDADFEAKLSEQERSDKEADDAEQEPLERMAP